MSIDVTFFETTLFSLSFIVTSQGEDDDLLVYSISSPVPTPTLALVKPPIIQVYSQDQNPPISSPTLATSSSNLVHSDDLLIAFRKGKRQCAHPISSFVLYNHLSSFSCTFIASLDSISFPNIVYEDLSHPSWHNAMVDECWL